MSVDPRQVGFAWPEETALTNVNGETIMVSPLSVNLSCAQEPGKDRVGQCYRYYTTPNGPMTELEVLTWYAGGHDASNRFLAAFKDIFDQGSQLSLHLRDVLTPLAQFWLSRYYHIRGSAVVGAGWIRGS